MPPRPFDVGTAMAAAALGRGYAQRKKECITSC
jgi:hypothetical protein